MQDTLAAEPGQPDHLTYLGNIILGADDILSMWEDTLEAMWRLICHSFPLNIWKLQLLVHTLNVLCIMMASSWYHIVGKALGSLFGSNLPPSAKELMTFLGHLNIAG